MSIRHKKGGLSIYRHKMYGNNRLFLVSNRERLEEERMLKREQEIALQKAIDTDKKKLVNIISAKIYIAKIIHINHINHGMIACYKKKKTYANVRQWNEDLCSMTSFKTLGANTSTTDQDKAQVSETQSQTGKEVSEIKWNINNIYYQ